MSRAQDKPTTKRDLEARVALLMSENRRLASERWLKDDEGLTALDDAEETVKERQGYYRFGCAADGSIWVRYKWTKGPWANHYVTGGHNYLAGAFLDCQKHEREVKEGKRIPKMDTPMR